MLEIIAFEEGYKPAILKVNNGVKVEELKKKHPHILFPHRHPDGLVLIFQGEEGKEWFEHNGLFKTIKDGKKVTDYKHSVLGLTLGFPPKAVSFFATSYLSREAKEQFDARKIGVSYHGYRFVTDINTLKDDIFWLYRNRPVPEKFRGKIAFSDMRKHPNRKRGYSKDYFAIDTTELELISSLDDVLYQLKGAEIILEKF